jgi:hypothetical protein
MILLVTPSQRADECVAALKLATGEEVLGTETLRAATSMLRAESFSAVVFDQYLLETEPDEIDTLLHYVGTAIPVQVNFGISGIERLVREVQLALRRRYRETQSARAGALQTLHSELNGTVTALLLSCELALETPGLPHAAVERMEATHELVKKLREQLCPPVSDEIAATTH